METTIERKESRKNGNKNIKCMICSRFIRSDHMKRHTKTHKDILSLGEEEARQELRSRHEVQMQREEKRQKLEEIAQQEGIPANLCTDISTTSFILDPKNLKEELLHDNQIYLDKIELGNQIATIIDEGTVREESLKIIIKRLWNSIENRNQELIYNQYSYDHGNNSYYVPSHLVDKLFKIGGQVGMKENHGSKATLKHFMAIQESFV